MKAYLKKHWEIACICIFLILILLSLAVVLAGGVHSNGLYRYQDYGIGLFADIIHGYSLVESEQRSYDADDVICLKISTAFVPTKAEAERIRVIHLAGLDNPVFDFTCSIGEPQQVDTDVDPSKLDYPPASHAWAVEVPCDGITLNDLKFRRNIFGGTSQTSFDFSFYVYLTVKEDAPENWTGQIYFKGWVQGEKDQYGNAVNGSFLVDYLTFSKNGDTIHIQ